MGIKMKTLYTVLFCLICSSALLAQNNWSFILGLNYSTFYDEENNDWIPGGTFGFEKDWQLIDDLGCQKLCRWNLFLNGQPGLYK